MSYRCRILKNQNCEITQLPSNSHMALDIVGKGYTVDIVLAHSSGVVVFCQTGMSNNQGSKGNESLGNCVKIKHDNGYYTLYGHLENDVKVKLNDKVEKGQTLGTMGNSGNSYGSHTHFEVRNRANVRINPINYLDNDLPNEEKKERYKIGDTVTFNKIFVSSTSLNSLMPLISSGVITKIYPGRNNPYLIDNGIGFVNDNSITSKTSKIQVGDYVKVKTGALDYNNVKLAHFVYETPYQVIEAKNNRIVVGIDGVVTCAVDLKNIISI